MSTLRSLAWLKRNFWSCRKYLYGWTLPLIYLPILLAFPASSPSDLLSLNSTSAANGSLEVITVSKSKAAGCFYVLLLMASYWLLEALPMAITAMLPVIFFPLFGILPSSAVCLEYMRDTVMIFLGSLVAAAAVEESNLHQRIALKVMKLFGTQPQWLSLGFMVNTMFLSMWISNTAATALMIPIVDAVLIELWKHKDDADHGYELSGVREEVTVTTGTLASSSDETPAARSRAGSVYSLSKRRTSLVRPSLQPDVTEFDDEFRKLRRCIYLGICYSANIGGTGTLTGTGTNLILYGFVSRDPSMSLSFASWMFYAVPGMVVCVAFSWLFLKFVLMRGSAFHSSKGSSKVDEVIESKIRLLGKMTFHEQAVLWLFVALIALWFFRSPEFMPGWAGLVLPKGTSESFIRDSCPAILIVVLYFMIPVNPMQLATSPTLMTWKATQSKIAWNVVLLLGGGFALSAGAKASGLSFILGNMLNNLLQGVPLFGVQVVTCAIALVLTEVASNATTATILLGVVENVARSMGVNPLTVMVPLTLSCSYAFVLPVASPPNAIIFEAGDMSSKDMAIPGFFMMTVCLIVTLLFTTFWGPITLF